MNQKRELMHGITSNLDQCFTQNEFQRRGKSFKFDRIKDSCLQTVDLHFEVRPVEDQTAIFAVYPYSSVIHPDVDCIVESLRLRDIGLLAGVTNGQTYQPIEIISQKQTSARWLVYSKSETLPVSTELCAVLERWAFPFFNSYSKIDDFLRFEETVDQRILRDRAHVVKIICAHLALDNIDKAIELANVNFGSLGLKKRYKCLFDFLEEQEQSNGD